MAHRHTVKTETTRSYTGTAAGAHYTPRGENRKAHGGVCHVAVCACGATRETNANGGAREVGTWQTADEE